VSLRFAEMYVEQQGLPDVVPKIYQISQFGFIMVGLGMENVGVFLFPFCIL
jgi:hypothetical protein